MAVDDFDVERLAAYLHLDPAQVARLAERSKLPGRKVAGGWRFSPAEIHHWLEERMGLSSDEELQQMELALQGPPGQSADVKISVAAALPLEAIAVSLGARTRGSVIMSMCDLAARTGWLWDPAKMAEAVRAREEMMPTALDSGVALLHPRRPLPNILGQALLAFGRTDRPIAFGGPHGAPTDLFFLICSVEDRGHLRMLARLSRLISDPALVDELRPRPTPALRTMQLPTAKQNCPSADLGNRTAMHASLLVMLVGNTSPVGSDLLGPIGVSRLGDGGLDRFECVRVDDVPAALAWIEDCRREPEVVLIFQTWPGQVSAAQVDLLARRLPLVRICAFG